MTVPRDAILRDATVVTMDDRRSVAGGLWLRGDRIAAAGDPERLVEQAAPDAEVVSLRGATVVPGLIDAHCHISTVGYLFSGADVSQPAAPDIPAIQERMREQARRTPPEAWVTGSGFVEYRLRENRYPTRWDLDAVIPDRPAVIYHTSLHGCVVNSVAFQQLGYADDSEDPAGGVLGRDENGRCNGVLLEMPSFKLLNENFARDMGSLAPADRARAIGRACRQYAALGLTGCWDAGLSPTKVAFEAFQDAEKAGELAIRVGVMFNQGGAGWLVESGFTSGFGSERLQVAGIKVFADGGMSSRTAAVDEPYPVPPYGTGVLFQSRERMTGILRRYHDAGLQIGVHAQGDRAIRTVLESFEDVIGRGSGNPLRHRIEHGGALYPHLLEHLAAVGVHVASQPAFLSLLGDGFLEAFGDDHGQLLYPFASIRRAGVVLGGSSDSPVITADPLLGMRDAVLRRTAGGRTLGASERLSPLEALELYTRNAAFLTSSESFRGSLEPGKFADYVVLAENPLEVAPEHIADIRVLRTVVAGATVYEAPAV